MDSVVDDWPTFGFEMNLLDEVQMLCQRLDLRLRRLFMEPISAKHVDTVLDISGKERRRWAKYGRLPACGHHLSNRTKDNFTVKTYDVDTVEKLLNRPGTIDG